MSGDGLKIHRVTKIVHKVTFEAIIFRIYHSSHRCLDSLYIAIRHSEGVPQMNCILDSSRLCPYLLFFEIVFVICCFCQIGCLM